MATISIQDCNSFVKQQHIVSHDVSTLATGLWQYLNLSLLWNTLLILLIAINFKNFPFIYHLRILNAIRFVLKSQRSPHKLTPDHLFQPMITSSKAPITEIDVFGHKSNSTYFTDVDIARTHLITTMFSHSIEKFRGGTTMNGLSGQPRSQFTMPLGAVSCTFRKEFKPYEAYDMWTRILSWDEKWFYLVTHFVKQGDKIEPTEHSLYPQQNSNGKKSHRNFDKPMCSSVCATALSKVVFKNGRMTVAPEVMLELAGLLPAKEDIQTDAVHAQLKTNMAEGLTRREAVKLAMDDVEKIEGSDSESSYDESRRSSTDQVKIEWTRERIERERQRGLETVGVLAKQGVLEDEFSGSDGPALGRHYDGHGIEGVVTTLAQLGGLSNYQLL
ncbi:hypothetical protein LTR64_002145 [Lithohypha guttulata]|uniref:Capsule polysaccharide biosynthesis protein n=1 Tax=Lithohypha guttulata TaxID=1690604 RepID=A0AAN7Y3R6_9EURO|nr:hypothetical protein LTR05_008359 [Lithohypha guttulata]